MNPETVAINARRITLGFCDCTLEQCELNLLIFELRLSKNLTE